MTRSLFDLPTRHRTKLVVLAYVAAMHFGNRAHADAGASRPMIVVESYAGDRPADAATALQPIYAELDRRGYTRGENLTRIIDERLSQESLAMSPSQIVDAQKAVDRSYERFVEGDYASALATAEDALKTYLGAPAVLAHEESLRDLEFKAMVIAGRSAQVLGHNDDAFRWMAEAIRSFGPRSPSATEFDPAVIALHRQVAAELKKQGTGSLEIHCDDPTATVFVDERFLGSGQVRTDVPPGRYRVFVAKGNQSGRVHVIDVAPGGTISVDVLWGLDGALTARGAYVGVAAADDDLRLPVAVARGLGASRVIVLTIRSLENRRAVVGYSVDVESQRRSYAAVQIDPLAPPAETLRRLAALLAGDTGVSTDDLITLAPTDRSTMPHRHRSSALLVLGASLLAGGVAVGFDVYAHDAYDASKREPDPPRQDALYDTANRRYYAAQGLAAVAVVGLTAGAWLWFHESHDDEPSVMVAPIGTEHEIGLAVEGSF